MNTQDENLKNRNQSPLKIVIEVRGGVVQSVKSNTPLQFIVIDYDLSDVRESPL